MVDFTIPVAEQPKDETFTPFVTEENKPFAGETPKETNVDKFNKSYEASQLGFIDATHKAFTSGDNWGYQLYKDIDRIYSAGPKDPTWDDKARTEWIKQNDIPTEQSWRYMQTINPVEAGLMHQDAQEQQRDQDILNRRAEWSGLTGFSTFAARSIAGIVDIDAPIMVATGGLSKAGTAALKATKWGRVTGMAAGVGAGGATAAEVGYLSDPNAEWTSVVTAGLFSAGIGLGIGSIAATRPARKPVSGNSKVPEGNDPLEAEIPPTASPAPASPEQAHNDALGASQREFADTVAEGAPRAQTDYRNMPHGDTFSVQAAKAEEAEAILAAEQAEAAKPKPEGESKPKKPELFKPEDVTFTDLPEWHEGATSNDAGSIGARQMASPSGPGVASIRSTKLQKIISAAKSANRASGISDRAWLKESNLEKINEPLAKAARRFHDIMVATPLASDSDRFLRTNTAVGQMMAYNLFENPAGIYRNTMSAAGITNQNIKQLAGTFMPDYDAGFKSWAARNHGADNFIKVNLQGSVLRENFNRAVIEEAMARRYNAKGTATDPDIIRVADALDRWSAAEVNMYKKYEVNGHENLAVQSGYVPQRMRGDLIRKLMASGKKEADIVKAVANNYKRMYPNLKPKEATTFAKAVIERSLNNADGVSMNMLALLKGDGRVAVEDLLKRNGVPAARVTKLIDDLTGQAEHQSREGFTKSRMDVDFRYRDPDTGIRLMDIMETDLLEMVGRRVRRSGGRTGLAFHGIKSKQDWNDLVDAMLEEQAALGPSQKTATGLSDKLDEMIDSNKYMTREDLDAYWSYFSGEPVAGGLSPIYSRIRKLTFLSTLNQLGLTSLAETGTLSAAVGWKRFTDMAGEAIMGELKNKNSPLVKELKTFDILIPEEIYFRDDYAFDIDKGRSSNEILRGLDNLLNKGMRAQGYVSAFYKVRNIQQRLAATIGASRLMKEMKFGSELTDARLYDMLGDDPKFIQNLKEYVKRGTVEFKDGELYKLNLDKWDLDPEDVMKFSVGMNRTVDQLVQKAQIGESNILFHKDGVASLFFTLKSFPLIAIQKQAYRNARMADPEAIASFAYGLAFAGAVYTARNALAGKTENLEPMKVAKGAFGMSNLTGWIPMWTDPLAGMLGAEELRFNNYGSYGNGGDILSLPPSFGVLNKLAKIPGSVGAGINPFDEMSNADWRNIQAAPIIGNLYGFNFIWNAMKDDRKLRAAETDAPPSLSDITGGE
jgi:hypothetical protein